MARILVTGAAGFIGRALCVGLAERGQWDRAAADFARAARFKDAPPPVRIGQALVALQQGDRDGGRRTLTALVDRCRVVLGGEPWPRQRTLDALGLEGLNPVSIRALVEGERAPVAAAPPARPRWQAGLVPPIASGVIA